MASSPDDEVIKVLLVDDEPSLLDLTKTFLERASDIRTVTVESGKEALDLLELKRFDAVVSDYQMPGMDGIELLKRIRGQGSTVPFILFTGKGREEMVIEALNNGADFYLQKGGDPVSMYTVLDHNIRTAVRERRVQDGLRFSELKFKMVFDVSFVALSLTDEEGRLVEWNHRAEKLTGLSAAEVIGRYEWDVLFDVALPENRNPEHGERLRQKYRKALEHGLPLSQQGAVQDGSLAHKDGSIVHFSQQVFTIPTSKGFLVYTVAWETTKYRRAVQETLESGAKYRAIFNEIEDLIMVFTVDPTDSTKVHFVELNEEAHRRLGYELSELDDVDILNILDMGGSEGLMAKSRKLYEDGSVSFETVFRGKDGSTFPAEVTNRLIALGGVDAVMVIAHDITERRKAQEELRRSEERFRSVFDNAADAILLFHTDGTIIDVNQAAVDRFGYSKEAFRDMAPWDLGLPEQRQALVDNASIRAGPIRFEETHRTKDGKLTDSEISARLITIDGKPTMISIIRDISERKRMEEGLKRAYEQVYLLSQITRHDIKNQLMIGKGYLGLISRDCVGCQNREMIGKLGTALNNIERQIDFTKLYQDLGSSPPSWHRVLDIISAIPNRGAVPFLEIGKGLDGLEVYADPMIEKVFYNLVENTIRYGSRPSRVRIDAQKRGDEAVITYDDVGPGIPYEEKELIFEKGYGKGTGLGLFLSRDILSLTDITVKETGEPGKGVRFEICLPSDKHRYASV